jgi:hypothetical protein
MAEHVRLWLGKVAAGKTPEHEAFVTWLSSDEAAQQLAKYLLSGYRLYQHNELLKVEMRAEEPLTFIRFLRNSRMWPPFWEFVAAGRSDSGGQAEDHGRVRVDWKRGEGARGASSAEEET